MLIRHSGAELSPKDWWGGLEEVTHFPCPSCPGVGQGVSQSLLAEIIPDLQCKASLSPNPQEKVFPFSPSNSWDAAASPLHQRRPASVPSWGPCLDSRGALRSTIVPFT